MLLELGSGDRPFSDGRTWIHTDERQLDHIERIMDAFHPAADLLGKCEEVRATHLLEHASHLETGAVLSRWRELLVPGGRLYIEVPNFEAQAKALLSGRFPEDEVVVLTFGGQDYEGNFHKTGFTPGTLENHLVAAGFESVAIMDADMVLCATGTNPVV